MIRLTRAIAGVGPAERFAIELLADLARLVPYAGDAGDIVTLEVTDDVPGASDVASLSQAEWHISHADGVVRIPRAVVRRISELVSGAHEVRSNARDRFGRVPSAQNEFVAAGLERDPVISRAAVTLRTAAVRASGTRAMRLARPWPGGKRWAAAVTHDLDVVDHWPAFTAMRAVELAGKGEVSRAARVLGAAAAAVAADPIVDGVDSLLAVERASNIQSTWFVLCGSPTFATRKAGDLTYVPEGARARRVLREVSARGHEIALHGSFETADHGDAFLAQRARLGALIGHAPVGVRQHFLRLTPGETPRAMASAQFTYDSTVGFSDRNGFRLGVADVLPMLDATAQRAVPLAEAPFCWMDRSLSKYQGIEDPKAWVRDALQLARACADVGGLWVGIWHPNVSGAALGYPDAAEAFEQLVGELAAGNPHTDTLERIVRWRAARRSVRALGVAADGAVTLHAGGTHGVVVELEDAHGVPRERVTT